MGIIRVIVVDCIPMQFAALLLLQVVHDTACPLAPIGNMFVLAWGQHDFMIGDLTMGMIHHISYGVCATYHILIFAKNPAVAAALVSLAVPMLNIFEMRDQSTLG